MTDAITLPSLGVSTRADMPIRPYAMIPMIAAQSMRSTPPIAYNDVGAIPVSPAMRRIEMH
jgi:hypothetical protein